MRRLWLVMLHAVRVQLDLVVSPKPQNPVIPLIIMLKFCLLLFLAWGASTDDEIAQMVRRHREKKKNAQDKIDAINE